MRIRTIGLTIAFLSLALAADFPTLEPKNLVAQLQAKGATPTLIHVGFPVMYRGRHIPASLYAGPAAKPEGLDAIKAAVEKLPRSRQIVIYCGCCPFDRCPNIRPAMALLKQMGFTNVKALDLPANFAADWVDHGYPVEQGPAAK
ncbi:MAG TPA: rhodanese-like domain-containing protein [Bryobacteraceae bacterium]|nr:rhodanese-like domain-containing protein [Bryobacteraceae bacterium]